VFIIAQFLNNHFPVKISTGNRENGNK